MHVTFSALHSTAIKLFSCTCLLCLNVDGCISVLQMRYYSFHMIENANDLEVLA